MSARPLVVIGDALLDRDIEGRVERLSPDAPVPVVDEAASIPRPGGAGLAALLAAADGHEVKLITALAADAAGRDLRAALEDAGVEVIDVGLDGVTPEKVRIRTAGRTLLRLDRGGRAAASVGPAGAAARAALEWAGAILVSDYGRGVAAEPGLRAALESAERAPIVWDPHPRGPAPVPGAFVVTPNRSEAAGFAPEVDRPGLPGVAQRAAALAERWGAENVCVTCGESGAVLHQRAGQPLMLPAVPARGDSCGAGDRFASRLAGGLAHGADLVAATADAVATASAFVASGGASAARTGSTAPAEPVAADAAAHVIATVRAAGGVVVATGGCFDLLHPGHVATLQAARALGDCLVVCINSDESVRRLKGPGRPVVPEADRAAVLAALACVDAVAVFDEDTPSALLDRLRPDVWAKGGDYAGADLPEAKVLERWGGQAVVLPYVDGRSTSALIQEVESRATG